MEFKRPESSVYPRVYETFKMKLNGSEKEEEFSIQDLTTNYFDDAVDILTDNHAKGAVFHIAARTLQTEEGRRYVKEKLLNTFKEKVSLICVNTATQEIVGLNCLYVRSSSDYLETKIRDNECYNHFKEACNHMNYKSEVWSRYEGVDQVLFAAGLCVVEKFRGNGFARRILAARAPLLHALGLTVTTAIFSTANAQKAAENAGYEELYRVTYEELDTEFPHMNFKVAFGRSCRVQALKV